MKAAPTPCRPYLCYSALWRWFAPCFERPRRARATLQSTCGCYFIPALSFFILTLKLLCSRVRALYIVRRNVNRGLLLRARGNVIQKQFEGNCKVMWPREPEAIETLNIISGQYNMFCRAAWKNRKTLPGQSLGNYKSLNIIWIKCFLKSPCKTTELSWTHPHPTPAGETWEEADRPRVSHTPYSMGALLWLSPLHCRLALPMASSAQASLFFLIWSHWKVNFQGDNALRPFKKGKAAAYLSLHSQFSFVTFACISPTRWCVSWRCLSSVSGTELVLSTFWRKKGKGSGETKRGGRERVREAWGKKFFQFWVFHKGKESN